MPCYDPTPYEDAKINKKKVDLLTDLLCKCGRAAFSGSPVPQDVVDWWMKHRDWDEKRGEKWDLPQSK